VDLAADDGDVGVDVGRQFQTFSSHLHEARQLRQQRGHVHAHDHLYPAKQSPSRDLLAFVTYR